jgi:hypothetical protein
MDVAYAYAYASSSSSFETIGQPAIGQPAIGQPAIGQPAIGQPAIGQPAIGQPAIGQPAIGQPAIGQLSARRERARHEPAVHVHIWCIRMSSAPPAVSRRGDVPANAGHVPSHVGRLSRKPLETPSAMFRMAMMGAPTLSLISCGGDAGSFMSDRNSSVQSCSTTSASFMALSLRNVACSPSRRVFVQETSVCRWPRRCRAPTRPYSTGSCCGVFPSRRRTGSRAPPGISVHELEEDVRGVFLGCVGLPDDVVREVRINRSSFSLLRGQVFMQFCTRMFVVGLGVVTCLHTMALVSACAPVSTSHPAGSIRTVRHRPGAMRWRIRFHSGIWMSCRSMRTTGILCASPTTESSSTTRHPAQPIHARSEVLPAQAVDDLVPAARDVHEPPSQIRLRDAIRPPRVKVAELVVVRDGLGVAQRLAIHLVREVRLLLLVRAVVVLGLAVRQDGRHGPPGRVDRARRRVDARPVPHQRVALTGAGERPATPSGGTRPCRPCRPTRREQRAVQVRHVRARTPDRDATGQGAGGRRERRRLIRERAGASRVHDH